MAEGNDEALISRAWWGVRQLLARSLRSGNQKRDYDQIFDYPTDSELTPDYYRSVYERGGIMQRVVRAYPQATWRELPKVCDESDDPENSKFVQGWADFCERMNIGGILERLDRLNGLGEYSVLLIGTSGALDQPARTGGKIAYLQPYAQYSATISTYEERTNDPRFGLPLIYQLQTKDTRTQTQGTAPSFTLNVHYSRVIHVAEFIEQSQVFGTPRLKALINYFLDLKKVIGSSAESFWRQANPGLFLGVDTKDGYVDDGSLKEIRRQVDDFINSLSRTVVGENLKASAIDGQVADPGPNIDRLVDLIAAASGIPKRILMGNEQGELGSSQDEGNWAARIDERRTTFAGPMIVRPMVQLAIDLGEIPAPQGKWWVDWQPAGTISEETKATIAVSKTTAIRNYASTPNARSIVAPEEFRIMIDLEPESDYVLEEPVEPALPDETGGAPGNGGEGGQGNAQGDRSAA